jgi:SNF2 family DNA or RNA helicase
VFVELSDAQRGPYEEQRATLARLAGKGFLTDLDRKRILACLTNMRMLCDSTYLYDKVTDASPKLDEFAELVPELVGGHKVVAFSQWETMVLKAAGVLDRLGVGYAVLHGGLSGKERKAALDRFKTDDECRVFLSTDAGGVGLNLQAADTVVNLELPWNPAVLEQRIARVHRMGQGNPVRVVNLVTRGTIEERVLRTLESKQNLFAGLFEGDEDEIAFAHVNPAKFTDAIRELLGEPPPEAVTPAIATRSDPARASFWRAGVEMVEALNASISAEATVPIEPSVRTRLHTALQELLRRIDDKTG